MRTANITALSVITTALYSVSAMAAETVAPVVENAEGAAAHASSHGEAATGLPQLDVTQFPSQLFWLAITGITLYILLSKFALPRIENMKRERDHFVHDHLRQAADVRRQAEDAKINYDVALRQAETKAKDVLTDTTTALRQKHDQALQDAMQKIQTETDAVEARLSTEKQKIMQSIDQRADELANDIMNTVFANTIAGKKGQVA
jgi:F-type H+-transporting ATPase subunit b